MSPRLHRGRVNPPPYAETVGSGRAGGNGWCFGGITPGGRVDCFAIAPRLTRRGYESKFRREYRRDAEAGGEKRREPNREENADPSPLKGIRDDSSWAFFRSL
jgi:hypothetical protein